MKLSGAGLRGTYDPWIILSFVIPFALYMMTLAPSVTFFDSGEFISATACLGSAHSPGYPLYLMYAKPFTWLPFGNIAFRVNMATAFSSSLACLGVYLLSFQLLKQYKLTSGSDDRFNSFAVRGAALAAALAFAATPRLWLQSNHDKPYPLLSFISVAIFLLLLQWRDRYRQGEECPAYVYVATLLAGMAMGLHQTIVLLLPAWVMMILLTDWRMIGRIKELILATACAMVGFSVNLYLPLRATTNPLLNWGDARTKEQFLWHFLRKGYPSDPHSRDLALLWKQICAFNIPREFTWLGLLLVLGALVFLWRRNRDIVIVYITAIITFLAVIAGYFNTIEELIFLTDEFFTPLYLLSAVLAGVGLYAILFFAVQRVQSPCVINFKVYALTGIIFLALPTALVTANYYENDQHNNYIAFDYGSNSLRSLPQNTVMFTWGDSGAFPLWYLQWVEKMRDDVDLPHTPHLVFDWYLESMPRLFQNSMLKKYAAGSFDSETCLKVAMAELMLKRPVFIDFSTRYSITFNDFLPVQKGIVYRMRPVNVPAGLPDLTVWDNYNSRGILEKISFLDLDTGKAILIYANCYLEAGEFLYNVGRRDFGQQMLNRSLQISPDMRPQVDQVLSRYGAAR